jgi:hypothetical protein
MVKEKVSELNRAIGSSTCWRDEPGSVSSAFSLKMLTGITVIPIIASQ